MKLQDQLKSLAMACAIAAYASAAGAAELWIITSNDATRIDSTTWSVQLRVAGVGQIERAAIDPADGKLLLLTTQGILKVDQAGDTATLSPLGALRIQPEPRLSASKETIWASSGKTLARYSRVGGAPANYSLPGAPSDIAAVAGGSVVVAQQSSIVFISQDLQIVGTIDAHVGPITDLEAEADGRSLWVAGHAGYARVNVDLRTLDGLGRAFVQPIRAVSAGNASEAWVVSANDVGHIDGTVVAGAWPNAFPLSPAQSVGADGAIVALAYEKSDKKIYIAGDRRIAQFNDRMELASSRALADLTGSTNKIRQLLVIPDVTPPTIEFTQPGQGALSNFPFMSVELRFADFQSGVDPSTLRVAVDADPSIEFACQTRSTGATCTPTTRLTEGTNTVRARIADKAGNLSAYATVAFTIDTIPPTVPPVETVQVTVDASGLAALNLPVGSIEPFALVSIRNVRTGEIVFGSMPAADALVLTLSVVPGDVLVLTATDLAGNLSLNLEIQIPENGPQIIIVTPSRGDAIWGDHVDVVGVFLRSNHVNTAITVNGVPARVAHDGQFAANDVPLHAGSNLLEAVARSPQGVVARASVSVSSDGTHIPIVITHRVDRTFPGFDDTFFDAWAVATLDDGSSFERIAEDMEADGQFGYEKSNVASYEARFNLQPGLRKIQFLWSRDGAEHVETDYLVVEQAGQLKDIAGSIFDDLKASLAAGQVEAAKSMFLAGVRDKYGKIFEAAGTDAAGAFGTSRRQPSFGYCKDSWCEMVIPIARDGRERGFILRMLQDTDGMWKAEAL